jgi:hypothetical protein
MVSCVNGNVSGCSQIYGTYCGCLGLYVVLRTNHKVLATTKLETTTTSTLVETKIVVRAMQDSSTANCLYYSVNISCKYKLRSKNYLKYKTHQLQSTQ